MADAKRGVDSYENWKAELRGDPIQDTYEVPLFSDGGFDGPPTQQFGPYIVIATVGEYWGSRRIHPVLTLRVDYHLVWDSEEDMSPLKEDTERYHGGNLDDEIAALACLILGVRLRAGGTSRMFPLGDDPKGRPVAWNVEKTPYLPALRAPLRVPRTWDTQSLAQLSRLSRFVNVPVSNATTLIRAARLYQEALWICEVDPSMAWLLFVSAIEAAASDWKVAHGQSDSPLTLLERIHPKLSALLGRPELSGVSEEIAKYLLPITRATQSFVDFVIAHGPDPPPVRPPEWAQLSFNEVDLRGVLKRLYRHRSKALHAGTPFPLPLCERPSWMKGTDAPMEVPLGVGTSALGGSWVTRDTSMCLHMFEYFVRSALLRWWDDMASPPPAARSTGAGDSSALAP